MTDTSALALLSSLSPAPRRVAGDGTSACVAGCTPVCDSRLANDHSLFVCIRGERFDGHRYIAQAYESGCRCFLVERLPDAPLPDDADVFLSDDTRSDLSLLAAAYYGHPANNMKIVGITGTKGKTTVALMCYHILTSVGLPVGYIGTCGVMYGDVHETTNNTTPGPLELHAHLARMRASGVKTVFLEVSSQALWQHRVHGIPFAAVAMTNLFSDHIGPGEHPDFDHYAACKKRLLTDFGAPFVLVNTDDRGTMRVAAGLSAVRCGIRSNADVQALEICSQQKNGRPGMTFAYHEGWESVPVFLPLPGEHNVYNALFALRLASYLGIDVKTAASSLNDLHIPGRLETLPAGEALIVIDYAHNGGALRAALTSLRPYAKGRLICLVGSVGERTQCRRAEIGRAAGELADFTILTADDPGFENVGDICREIAAAMPQTATYTIVPDRKEAIRTALNELTPGDVLLLAGKGDEQFQKIAGTLVPHNDRKVVEEYFDLLSLPI